MDKLGVNLGFFLFQVFNFTIMAILLYAWAYKPILKMLKTRREKIAQGLEDAQVAAQARANAEQEAAKIIAEAQANAAQILREATERAEAAGREVKASVEAEIAKEREAALAEVQIERERILGELRGQVAALSIAAAQKLVGQALDEERQHALLNEFFSGVREGKVVVLESGLLSGDSVEVISALPLTDEEKEIVKKDILSKLGSQANVAFQVDPAILGGIVINAGGKVLDASVAGQLESMRQRLG